METQDIEIIDSLSLKTLSIDVTEKIKDKYLHEFIRTNIFNSDILVSPNSKYYCRYLSQSLRYEIIVFDTNKSAAIIEPLAISNYYENNSSETTDLFVCSNYFCIYCKGELLLYKNISQVTTQDVQNYIQSSYKITLDNIIHLSQDELGKLKEKNTVKLLNDFEFTSIYEDNSYKFFQIFVLVCTIIFCYLFYTNSAGTNVISKQSSEVVALEKRYNNLLNSYQKNAQKPVDNTLELFKYLKLQKITIEYVNYKNNVIHTILTHKNKKTLLDFVSIQNENINIKSIKYHESKKVYKMEITIAL